MIPTFLLRHRSAVPNFTDDYVNEHEQVGAGGQRDEHNQQFQGQNVSAKGIKGTKAHSKSGEKRGTKIGIAPFGGGRESGKG